MNTHKLIEGKGIERVAEILDKWIAQKVSEPQAIVEIKRECEKFINTYLLRS